MKKYFSDCLLQLEYADEHTPFLVKFIVDRFTKINFDDISSTCLQLFEPGVLNEIALVNKRNLMRLENFDYDLEQTKSENLKNLQWMLKNRQYLTSQQKINLAYSLDSLVRYKLARSLLAEVDYNKLRDDWKLYYLFCDFCIANRYENNENVEEIFQKAYDLMLASKASDLMIILFASQYIVWSLKTAAIFMLKQKMLNIGQDVANKLEIDIRSTGINLNFILLSSWYRALAMLPASERDLVKTREYMEKALKFSESIAPTNVFEEYNKKNLIKTYHESSLKEYLYLGCD